MNNSKKCSWINFIRRNRFSFFFLCNISLIPSAEKQMAWVNHHSCCHFTTLHWTFDLLKFFYIVRRNKRFETWGKCKAFHSYSVKKSPLSVDACENRIGLCVMCFSVEVSASSSPHLPVPSSVSPPPSLARCLAARRLLIWHDMEWILRPPDADDIEYFSLQVPGSHLIYSILWSFLRKSRTIPNCTGKKKKTHYSGIQWDNMIWKHFTC